MSVASNLSVKASNFMFDEHSKHTQSAIGASRQTSLGDEKWQVETAMKYGMLSTLNSRGRPKKVIK